MEKLKNNKWGDIMKDTLIEEILNQKWDTETLRLCSEIYEFKGRHEIFERQNNRVYLSRMYETAFFHSVKSSGRMDGVITTDFRLKKISGDRIHFADSFEAELLGYSRTLHFLHEKYIDIDISSKSILELQKQLFSALMGDYSRGGCFRENSSVHSDVERICKIYQKMVSSDKTEPLALISLFIYDFILIEPFDYGNFRMSMLVLSLLLLKNGFDIIKYVSLEKKIEDTEQFFIASLSDPNAFIKYILRRILDCYKDFERMSGLSDPIDKTISSYEIVSGYVLHTTGEFTVSDVIVNCPRVGRTSAFNVLKRLVDEGTIKKFGERQNAVYRKT